MAAQVIADWTPGGIALAAIAVLAIGIVPALLLSWMLGSCIGADCPPARRALIAVGLAYLATVAIIALWGRGEFTPLLALVPLPGAFAVFALRLYLARKTQARSGANRP
ncbi:hypothetical protein [Pelagerythrobacter sp.]|uniref:hypothetical protein n=1 Tax=Pelagerythrobacter sp. TaxID=2800702 RepID=UPI0035B1E444